ncbi:hypothetical protein SteCoe_6837 [Stentor coeruleus]|uniref:cGMP-dependent protein kinase n=1 Tax=Stentor coeruleus TaxID=5963 RepID=A0A1R2CP28_9CILI|nr:hypothetical protein SteCoe_6837 [Stentor coeruleus]
MGKCMAKQLASRESTVIPFNEELKIEIKSAQEIQNPINPGTRDFLLSTLNEHPLFRGLSIPVLDSILKGLRFLVVPQNEFIITQGETGNFFYILNNGEADIIVNGGKVGEYTRGGCFGDIALLTNSRRKASIKSTSKCSLWAIDRDTFKTTIRSITSSNEDTIKQLLFKAPFLSFLPESSKHQILKNAVLNNYSDNESIITIGQEIWFIYIIKSGIVKVIVSDNCLGTLSEGQVFGEGPLLFSNNNKRLETVNSVGMTEIISVDQKIIKDILGVNFYEILIRNIIINCLISDENFKFLDFNAIKKLAELFELITLKDDQVAIKYVEDVKNYIYIVCYGKIESVENSYSAYQMIGLNNNLAGKIGKKPYKSVGESIIACVKVKKLENVLGCSVKFFKLVLSKIYMIKDLYLFCSLDIQLIEQISASIIEVKFLKNQVIFEELDNDDFLYIVVEGAVGIFSNRNLIARLDKMSTFGESCITTPDRLVSAKALTKCVLYQIEKSSVSKFTEMTFLEKIHRKQYYETFFTMVDMRFSNKVSSLCGREYYYAYNKLLDCFYFIEAIYKHTITNHEKFAEIVDEKCILVHLDHPHIPKLLRTFSDANYVYFAYEYFPFEYLSTYKKIKFRDGDAKFIILSLCGVLGYLHKKCILHRDISKNNILIDEKGRVWLFGFNYASKVENRSYTVLDTNPEYKAKEVILGRGYSKASEYWSLGVLLFELLTGGLPFEIRYNDYLDEIAEKIIKNPLVIPDYIDIASKAIIEGLLQENPLKRFQFEDIKESSWGKNYNINDINNHVFDGLFKPTIKKVNAEDFIFRDTVRKKSSIFNAKITGKNEEIEWDEYF